jgi:maleate cis-trans isomerase
MQRPAIARIGVLVSGQNPAHEREFSRLDPAGAEFRFATFAYPPKGTSDFCGRLVEQMSAPIAELKSWGMDLLLVGCTIASMACDRLGFQPDVQQMAGVPVVTAASATREAIAALGLKTLGVASPYGEANNGIIVDFLRHTGADIIAFEGLALDRSPELWQGALELSVRQVLESCLRVNALQVDAVYLPCASIDSLLVIEEFERLTAKIAFSSVQASFWASLRKLGVDAPQRGAGRLLSKWPWPQEAASA